MHNNSQQTNVETSKVTVSEAKTKAYYHQRIIQTGGLTDTQLKDDYIALGYYNQIILKNNLKQRNK